MWKKYKTVSEANKPKQKTVSKNGNISFFFFYMVVVSWGLPCGSDGKESTCNVGDLCLIPGLGSSPGEGKGYPLQYCGLENSMVHGVAESDRTERLLLT